MYCNLLLFTSVLGVELTPLKKPFHQILEVKMTPQNGWQFSNILKTRPNYGGKNDNPENGCTLFSMVLARPPIQMEPEEGDRKIICSWLHPGRRCKKCLKPVKSMLTSIIFNFPLMKIQRSAKQNACHFCDHQGISQN